MIEVLRPHRLAPGRARCEDDIRDTMPRSTGGRGPIVLFRETVAPSGWRTRPCRRRSLPVRLNRDGPAGGNTPIRCPAPTTSKANSPFESLTGEPLRTTEPDRMVAPATGLPKGSTTRPRTVGGMATSNGSTRFSVVPLVTGSIEGAEALASHLAERSILAPAIRPPTVPAGSLSLAAANCCANWR